MYSKVISRPQQAHTNVPSPEAKPEEVPGMELTVVRASITR